MSATKVVDLDMEKVAVKAAEAYCIMNFPNAPAEEYETAKIDFEAGFITAVKRLEDRGIQIIRGLEAIERLASKHGEVYSQAEIRYMIEKLRGLK